MIWLPCSAETQKSLALLDEVQARRDAEDAAHIEKVASRALSWKEGQEMWEAAKAEAVNSSSIKQLTL